MIKIYFYYKNINFFYHLDSPIALQILSHFSFVYCDKIKIDFKEEFDYNIL